MIKKGYITQVKGHKNSKGELAEWVVKDHNTNKIISSHKTKEEAKSHLRDMKTHGNSILGFNKANNIDDLIKKAWVGDEVWQWGVYSPRNESTELLRLNLILDPEARTIENVEVILGDDVLALKDLLESEDLIGKHWRELEAIVKKVNMNLVGSGAISTTYDNTEEA